MADGRKIDFHYKIASLFGSGLQLYLHFRKDKQKQVSIGIIEFGVWNINDLKLGEEFGHENHYGCHCKSLANANAVS